LVVHGQHAGFVSKHSVSIDLAAFAQEKPNYGALNRR
jgi:hypothetical protein